VTQGVTFYRQTVTFDTGRAESAICDWPAVTAVWETLISRTPSSLLKRSRATARIEIPLAGPSPSGPGAGWCRCHQWSAQRPFPAGRKYSYCPSRVWRSDGFVTFAGLAERQYSNRLVFPASSCWHAARAACVLREYPRHDNVLLP
jgi:hypothetical protein